MKDLTKDLKKVMNEDQPELSDLEDQLAELQDALKNAEQVARDTVRTARVLGGEIDRVVGGQLEGYLIGSLRNFTTSESQPGAIPSLLNFLETEQETD